MKLKERLTQRTLEYRGRRGVNSLELLKIMRFDGEIIKIILFIREHSKHASNSSKEI